MAEQSQLARLGLRTGTVGSSSSLAFAFGNSGGTTPNSVHTAANRTGLYADLTGGSEAIGLMVGGIQGPIHTRSGTVVNTQITGTFTAKSGALVGIALQPQGGAANFTGTITTALLTANRTYTLPDASGTIPISTGGLGTNQNIVYTDSLGNLQTAAGLIVVGTPSATVPNTGTNGPGTLNGIVATSADALASNLSLVSYGNGSANTDAVYAYAMDGTAAAPAATLSGSRLSVGLRGYDGTNYTSSSAQILFQAASNWSGTNKEAYLQFAVVPNASTTSTNAWRIDSQSCLVSGSGNSVGTFSAGTLRPHIMTTGTVSGAGIAQSIWTANTTGATGIFAKSRSGTVGTQGVITTGDTLGTLSWQGDDGTNFIQAAAIIAIAEGTIATGQVPGRLRFFTASAAGTTTQALFIDSSGTTVYNSATATNSSTVFTGGTITPKVQIIGTTANSSAFATARFSADANAGSLYFAKSRGASAGTMTAVTTGDILGTISFQAADGTNFNASSAIIATVTGTVAGSRTPGNLVFQTGADAAGSALTTALTINNAQQVTVNATTASSSTTTGALVNNGGEGIAGAVFIGGAGTVTTSLPALNVTQTWNAGAVTFTGIFANMTSTSSAAGSLVMDLQVGSSSVFKVQKDGVVTAAASTDIAAQFGYLKVGFVPSGATTSVYIGQTSVFTTGNYALLQNSSGDTAINAANTKSVTIRQGGATRFTVANLVTTSATTFTIAAATVASGTSVAFLLTGAINTNMTASNEVPDADFNLNRTVQWAAGALATQRAVVVRAPTYAFVSASTITTAATVAITSGPIAGTNATLTKSIALWVQAGYTQFDGRVLINTPNSAPADADIPTSAISWYLNEAGNLLSVRVRYSDGTTLKTGTVALI